MNFICDHPDIRAISFVGGDPAGRHIYNRGSANGKRVQVFLRLSNLTLTLTIIFSVVQHGGQEPWSDHARCQQGICCQPGAWLIFIPHLVCWQACIKIFFHMLQLVGAAFGAAGQRCMALTTAVMVWIFIFLIGSFPWLPCSLHLIALASWYSSLARLGRQMIYCPILLPRQPISRYFSLEELSLTAEEDYVCFGPRLGQVMKPAQIFPRSFHLRQKPGSRGWSRLISFPFSYKVDLDGFSLLWMRERNFYWMEGEPR